MKFKKRLTKKTSTYIKQLDRLIPKLIKSGRSADPHKLNSALDRARDKLTKARRKR